MPGVELSSCYVAVVKEHLNIKDGFASLDQSGGRRCPQLMRAVSLLAPDAHDDGGVLLDQIAKSLLRHPVPGERKEEGIRIFRDYFDSLSFCFYKK